jgi:hypothetical protein
MGRGAPRPRIDFSGFLTPLRGLAARLRGAAFLARCLFCFLLFFVLDWKEDMGSMDNGTLLFTQQVIHRYLV